MASEATLNRHVLFGYGAQLSSFLVLAVANVALPNVLGIEQFGRFNRALAAATVSVSLFGEGWALAIVRNIRSGRLRSSDRREVARAVGVFVGISICVMACIMLFEELTARAWHRAGFTASAAPIVVATLAMAAYVPLVAVLMGELRTELVMLLGVFNGVVYILWPIALSAFHWPIAWAPAGVYVCSLGLVSLVFAAFGPLRLIDMRPPTGTTEEGVPVAEGALLAAAAAYRVMLIWLPLLIWGQSAAGLRVGAVYKIALSIVIGAVALMPFPRQSMLALTSGPEAATRVKFELVARIAVIMSLFAAIAVACARNVLVQALFSAEYADLASFLRGASVVVLVQVSLDIIFNECVSHGELIGASVPLVCGGIATGVFAVLIEPMWVAPCASGVALAAYVVWQREAVKVWWRLARWAVVGAIIFYGVDFLGRGHSTMRALGIVLAMSCVLVDRANIHAILRVIRASAVFARAAGRRPGTWGEPL